jgi:hypothetical protein
MISGRARGRRILGCRRGGVAAAVAVAVAAVAGLARHGAEQRECDENGELGGHPWLVRPSSAEPFCVC